MKRWFRKPEPPSPSLQEDLVDLDRFILRSSGQLPTPAVVKARWIIDTLREILGTADNRPLDIQAELTVRGVTLDYLPTTLRRFLSVDESAGASPALDEQLDTLQQTATSTLAAVRALDSDALLTQGNFLRAKFVPSELDL